MLTDFGNHDVPPNHLKPLVAVWMVAYNHGNYIEQAIESVMFQQTSFGFKLYIGEDLSSDQTRDICIKLKEKYPDKIALFLHEKNIGGDANGRFMYDVTFGSGAKYIALLEGDDYWTDPQKLQLQVDFLEQNQQCVFCFHKAFKIFDRESGLRVSYPKWIGKNVLNESDFFKIPTIPTASVVFRNEIVFPELYHSHGDLLLYGTLLSKGQAGFIDLEMSIYRLHDNGISARYNENWYLERRIGELVIEQKFSGFSQNVRNEIEKILNEHIQHYLNKNRSSLDLQHKMQYLKILIGLKSFYTSPIRQYATLVKTLLQ